VFAVLVTSTVVSIYLLAYSRLGLQLRQPSTPLESTGNVVLLDTGTPATHSRRATFCTLAIPEEFAFVVLDREEKLLVWFHSPCPADC
jgi:hypothetical protein